MNAMKTHIAKLSISDIAIEKPAEKLRTKFGLDDLSFVPFGAYDGYRTPRERVGVWDDLELEDLLITVSMNSRVGANAVVSFFRGIRDAEDWFVTATDLLRRLPSDLHLADATDESIHDLDRLFRVLTTVRGIGIPVAGKILCRKRPRLAPMLDSRVGPFVLYHALFQSGQLQPTLRGQLDDWTTELRLVLRQMRNICKTGNDQLSQLCNRFSTELRPGEELSPLRAIESLLWWELDESNRGDAVCGLIRQYWAVWGWQWIEETKQWVRAAGDGTTMERWEETRRWPADTRFGTWRVR
jgi:hypothetical protein